MVFVGFLHGTYIGSTVYVGEKPTVILYTFINHHAGTQSKKKTIDTMRLDTAKLCYIGSRIGWVSALLHYHIISHQEN